MDIAVRIYKKRFPTEPKPYIISSVGYAKLAEGKSATITLQPLESNDNFIHLSFTNTDDINGLIKSLQHYRDELYKQQTPEA